MLLIIAGQEMSPINATGCRTRREYDPIERFFWLGGDEQRTKRYYHGSDDFVFQHSVPPFRYLWYYLFL